MLEVILIFLDVLFLFVHLLVLLSSVYQCRRLPSENLSTAASTLYSVFVSSCDHCCIFDCHVLSCSTISLFFRARTLHIQQTTFLTNNAMLAAVLASQNMIFSPGHWSIRPQLAHIADSSAFDASRIYPTRSDSIGYVCCCHHCCQQPFATKTMPLSRRYSTPRPQLFHFACVLGYAWVDNHDEKPLQLFRLDRWRYMYT